MHDRSLLLRMQQKVAVTLSSFSISPMDLPSLFALINFCLFFRNAWACACLAFVLQHCWNEYLAWFANGLGEPD